MYTTGSLGVYHEVRAPYLPVPEVVMSLEEHTSVQNTPWVVGWGESHILRIIPTFTEWYPRTRSGHPFNNGF